MPMTHNDFLNAIIDDGIESVRQGYTKPNQHLKRDAAIEGFERCRGKTDEELLGLLMDAKLETQQARSKNTLDYWKVRYIELEIEWILQVLQAARYGQGIDLMPEIPVMGRALRKAADILGTADK